MYCLHVFFGIQYYKDAFNDGNLITSSSIVQEMKKVDLIKGKIFVVDNPKNIQGEDFIDMVRWADPISPYKYQQTKEHPFSKTTLSPGHRVGRFRVVSKYDHSRKGTFLIRKDLMDKQGTRIKVDHYITINNKDFCVVNNK